MVAAYYRERGWTADGRVPESVRHGAGPGRVGRFPRGGDVTCQAPFRRGGIVLCGGRSSRMGRPKAWLPFGGRKSSSNGPSASCGRSSTRRRRRGARIRTFRRSPTRSLIARDDQPYLGPLNGLGDRDSPPSTAGRTSRTSPPATCRSYRPALSDELWTSLGEADVCLPEIGGFHIPWRPPTGPRSAGRARTVGCRPTATGVPRRTVADSRSRPQPTYGR